MALSADRAFGSYVPSVAPLWMADLFSSPLPASFSSFRPWADTFVRSVELTSSTWPGLPRVPVNRSSFRTDSD